MATNDTDPQAAPPFEDEGSRTDPGAPSDVAADVAASLLADLAKAPLPTAEVRETEGHVAAAYAARPHHPPRANEKTIENAAVVVNATMPLGRPPAPAPAPAPDGRGLGPPASPVVSMNGAPTVPSSRVFEATSPGERARYRTRVVVASVVGAILAGVIAIGIVVLSSPRAPAEEKSAAPVSPSPSDPMLPSASISTSPSATVAAAASSSPSPSASSAVSVKPAHGLRPHPSSPSSGKFADPDRTF